MFKSLQEKLFLDQHFFRSSDIGVRGVPLIITKNAIGESHNKW